MGLRINYKKTQAMALNLIDPETIKLSDGKVIEFVTNFCYLGSYVRHSKKDLQVRKAQAWKAANKLMHF